MTKFKLKYLAFFFLFVNGCDAQRDRNNASIEISNTEWTSHILTNFKKNESIKGLAFAIFDSTQIIEELCLGKSTYDYPIDNKTLFSIQSISKNITALAVMFAVQDSLLDIDKPITEYLPDFKINSCFESNPEQRITLKMLLSHTAGFTHEAPVGNNYDCDSYSYSEHLNSISETWLKFPVGSHYSYSNLGFDVAAKIVEQATGMKYNNYLSMKIFVPLGLKSTTSNDEDIISNTNKTEGTISSTNTKHFKIPLIGSGAVYTNLHDFVIYVQLLMRNGNASKSVIDKKYLFDMYTIRKNNYGLGTYIDKSDDSYYINHNGSGYGFSASFLWFPEYNLGTVLLCNNQINTFNTSEVILKEYINRTNRKKEQSLTKVFDILNEDYFKNPDAYNLGQRKYCSEDNIYKARWEKYTGTYSLIFKGLDFKWYAKLAFAFGHHPQKVEIFQEDQNLKINSQYGESILREFKEGMFFTNGGEVVDFNTEISTYKNIKMEKIK